MNIITCDCGNVLHGADFQPIYCWCCGAWWYPIETKPVQIELTEQTHDHQNPAR